MSEFSLLPYHEPAAHPHRALALAHSLGCAVVPVGSRRCVKPPPEDTDDDWLVLAPSVEIIAALSVGSDPEALGRSLAGDETGFVSHRIGDLNLIITLSDQFFRRFLRAHEVCALLNLANKSDRIIVFRAILYEETPQRSDQ